MYYIIISINYIYIYYSFYYNIFYKCIIKFCLILLNVIVLSKVPTAIPFGTEILKTSISAKIWADY